MVDYYSKAKKQVSAPRQAARKALCPNVGNVNYQANAQPVHWQNPTVDLTANLASLSPVRQQTLLSGGEGFLFPLIDDSKFLSTNLFSSLPDIQSY